MRFAIVLAMMIVAMPCGGCGATQRETVIRDAYVATSAAEIAFESYDHDHQIAIVAAAKSKPEGQAALDAYRAKRDRVVLLFRSLLGELESLGVFQ